MKYVSRVRSCCKVRKRLSKPRLLVGVDLGYPSRVGLDETWGRHVNLLVSNGKFESTTYKPSIIVARYILIFSVFFYLVVDGEDIYHLEL